MSLQYRPRPGKILLRTFVIHEGFHVAYVICHVLRGALMSSSESSREQHPLTWSLNYHAYHLCVNLSNCRKLWHIRSLITSAPLSCFTNISDYSGLLNRSEMKTVYIKILHINWSYTAVSRSGCGWTMTTFILTVKTLFSQALFLYSQVRDTPQISDYLRELDNYCDI